MTLSDTGQSRVNGYLFVLERSLGTFLPREVTRDAVREIESHLRDRIAAAAAVPDERVALERVLAELGPPLRVAQAFSAERIVEEAVTTGAFVAIVRAVWHAAAMTATGFAAALGLFCGYAAGAGFIAIGALKIVFPANVGIWVTNGGIPLAFAAKFPVPPDERLVGGYWVVPLAVGAGLAVLVGTHRAARRYLGRVRERWASRAQRNYDGR